ncbi:hypothetical protein F4778DRAFT_4678 [Xylariomycetidae sp. FL2044]|nr:hypothetical protein F4778DRAFT_4678 [Xylariomycetidae sp. FL2044]
MTDYASLKVPELKKLLQEKSLPVAGNKADLIARLQEHDQAQEVPEPQEEAAPAQTATVPAAEAEDIIDWDDDDTAPATTKPAEAPKPAEPIPAAEPPKPVEPAAATTTATVDDEGDKPAEQPSEDVAKAEEAPKTDFSAHLPASVADEEARKRQERAKRFGIVEEGNDEDKKKADRAKRFGVEESSLPSGLDAALPEKRPRKRGREGGNADGDRDNKRQNGPGGRQRGGGGRGRGRHGGGGGGRPGGRDGRRDGKPNGAGPRRNILDDPTEKSKAEARAKRFAGGA